MNRLIYNKNIDANIPKDAIYVGRGSKWGNPFKAIECGSVDIAIDLYEEWLYNKLKVGEITLREISDIYNKPLICYCYPNRCHSEVLLKVAKLAHSILVKRS